MMMHQLGHAHLTQTKAMTARMTATLNLCARTSIESAHSILLGPTSHKPRPAGAPWAA